LSATRPKITFSKIPTLMERPYFGTVTITHYTLAKARLAARAHSRECRARPDVEKNRRGTYTASTRERKWQIPSEIGKIATWAVAANGLLRRIAARHAACARSPGCTPRPDVGGARPAHARAIRWVWEMRLVELGGWGGSIGRPRITFWASVELRAARTAACV